MVSDKIPLSTGNFTLDSSGVAGFFGGEEAVSAMGTVHLYQGRKWLGWYNSPGSYTVAKEYGQIANSRLWCALFPGTRSSPAEFFGLDGIQGPEYIGAHSGTYMKSTGHLAHIFVKGVEDQKVEVVQDTSHRRKRPSFVTVAHLEDVGEVSTGFLRPTSQISAFFVMASNIAACVACGVYQDWFCFTMILLGMVSNGISCFVIGSGKLRLQKPEPSLNSPPADGVLITDSEVIVLRGSERTVGSVITGRLQLDYTGEPHFSAIGMCSMFQYAQFLAQLLLIPQGALFGQVMFLSTLAASWMYNCYLSSLDKEKLQVDLLMNTLGRPKVDRFQLRTRTTMVVFALLVLKPHKPELILNRLLPNDTETWQVWKREVLGRLRGEREFIFDKTNADGVVEWELLQDLYSDAESAHKAYLDYFGTGSEKEGLSLDPLWEGSSPV